MNLLINEYMENFVKIIFMSIFTLKLNYKILNLNERNLVKQMSDIIKLILTSIINIGIQLITESTTSIIFLIVFISLIFEKNINRNIGYALLITTISTSVNYILYAVAILVSFIIFKVCNLNNDFIIFIVILIIYIILNRVIYRIKRFNKGISFLTRNEKNEYLGMIILNISIGIIFLFAMLKNINTNMDTLKSVFIYVIIFTIIMFITIQKSLQLYYKQKLQERETEEIKEELKNKNKKIKELEKENLELNKKNHSIAHKQKALEYELNQIKENNNQTNNNNIKSKIENLSKEIQNENIYIELKKTNIDKIDNMLKYMQSECIKNKIDFQLQVNGNIHHMTNKYIKEEDLEILIADLIKNAIIAINHTESINKSILVRLGIIDGAYSLYVYDSGIEFKIDTLLNLGLKPSTTHKNEGGTGMGLMNIFNTLKKYKASLIIDEYGKPVPNNFTKVMKVIFDNNQRYEINSYRQKEIEKKDTNKRICQKLK